MPYADVNGQRLWFEDSGGDGPPVTPDLSWRRLEPMNTPLTPAVRLRGVTKDFGDVHAVRGIDLEIQPGEMVAFLGPNGAGKTTTIDMVLGLSHPRRARSRCSAWRRARPSPAAWWPP